MLKYLFITLCIAFLACQNASNNNVPSNNWSFKPQNNSPILDKNAGVIILQYQQLVQGFVNKDTFYIKEKCAEFIRLTDSLSALNIIPDSNSQNVWEIGVQNINAELQGLNNTNLSNWEELYATFNMCSIQILNFLGAIGYQQNNIYIFNSNRGQNQDAFYWFGLQKNGKDPFNANYRAKQTLAAQVLQETK
jgi:hypothetical protein